MTRRRCISFPDSSDRQRHRGDADEDRISSLPDPVLGHILSLLPTKYAVATGILSKRWKLLWTTAFNLDFCCTSDFTGSVERFVQFVNYVLLFHKPEYFKRLSLTWKTGCIPFYVNTWITAALDRDVHELYISVDISKLPIHVQTYMFNSETLQSLELKCNICISSEIVFSLPRLERLKLTSVYFQSKKAFDNLLDGCPILKHLVLHINVGKMVKHGHISIVDGIAVNVDGSEFKCMISSAFLTHLDLLFYGIYSSRPQVLFYVELDAPSLHCIRLDGCIIQQKSLALLDEADIQISGRISEEPNYCNSLVDAVSAFGCAKNLTLCHQVIQALSCATMKMSTRFDRLTSLKVFIDLNNCSSLQDIIKLSDNLQVLIVDKVPGYSTKLVHLDNSSWRKPDLVPRCLSKSLRRVQIDAYDGYPDELAMVDYIIKHGRVLQMMQICFGETARDLKRKYELLQEISAFPRKSKSCELKIVDYGCDDDAL